MFSLLLSNLGLTTSLVYEQGQEREKERIVGGGQEGGRQRGHWNASRRHHILFSARTVCQAERTPNRNKVVPSLAETARRITSRLLARLDPKARQDPSLRFAVPDFYTCAG